MTRLIGHLLLVLCLVFNGIGASALAPATPLEHGTMAIQPSSKVASPASECHEMAVHATFETEGRQPLAAPVDQCCDPGLPCDARMCDGACAPHAITELPVMAIRSNEDLRNHYRSVLVTGREDPSLRQPVRPPIA